MTGHSQRIRASRYLSRLRPRLRGMTSGAARTNSTGIPGAPGQPVRPRRPPGATPRAEVTRPHPTRGPDQLRRKQNHP